jgi:hypothetical protein
MILGRMVSMTVKGSSLGRFEPSRVRLMTNRYSDTESLSVRELDAANPLLFVERVLRSGGVDVEAACLINSHAVIAENLQI